MFHTTLFPDGVCLKKLSHVAASLDKDVLGGGGGGGEGLVFWFRVCDQALLKKKKLERGT